MMTVFVVKTDDGFLDWDDRGAMSTGYPIWGSLERARKYQTFEAAENSALAAKRIKPHQKVWVVEVSLVMGHMTAVALPEDDPEWADYQRLKEKFKNK